MMLHTKYQGSRPCGFRHEVFFSRFPYKSLFKTFDPKRGHFWPKGYNLNKLGRGPLGDATYMLHTKYQESRPCGFRQEDFSTFSLYKPM